MKYSEETESDGKFIPTPGDPWMGPLEGDTGLTPMLPEAAPKENEMGDGELPTESGGESTETTGGPAMASAA